jgi:hypothetical protein
MGFFKTGKGEVIEASDAPPDTKEEKEDEEEEEEKDADTAA